MNQEKLHHIKKTLSDYFMITFGLFIVALSIHLFMEPNNFVTGGVSGLAIVLRNLLSNVPDKYKIISLWGLKINLSFFFTMSGIMFVINTLLYIIGIIFIGFKFGLRTIFCGYMLNFIFYLLQKVYPIEKPLMDDLFIQLLVLSVMGATGLAIVFRHHASTGGTDITGKIINKYFHLDLGKAVLISDLFIALLALSINGFSSFIYGVVGIFLNGTIIDYLLNKFSESKEVVIISIHPKEIIDFIIKVLDKGATIYEARGAYTNEKKEIIRTILSRKEFYKLKDFILSIDKNAFLTVNDIRHTYGLGFMDITE
ncbi:MAG TPA: YitT family protein [Haloplasmataceae bacterium]